MKLSLVGLFASMSLAGCTASSDGQLELSVEDSGKQATVSVGQEVDLVLQTVGPGEYGDPVLSSNALRFVDMTIQPPFNPGGPRQRFRFTAVSPGTESLHIPHSEPTRDFDLVIVVEN